MLGMWTGAALLAGDESMEPGGQGSVLQNERGLRLHEPPQGQLLQLGQGLAVRRPLEHPPQAELSRAALHLASSGVEAEPRPLAPISVCHCSFA